jgi:hypothetical protein
MFLLDAHFYNVTQLYVEHINFSNFTLKKIIY